MKNVYIYCEGPTEESFINEILYPYFFNNEIVVYPIIPKKIKAKTDYPLKTPCLSAFRKG